MYTEPKISLLRFIIGLLVAAFGILISSKDFPHTSETIYLILHGINHAIFVLGILIMFFIKDRDLYRVAIYVMTAIMIGIEVIQMSYIAERFLGVKGRYFDWWDIITPLIILLGAWIYNNQQNTNNERKR